MASLHDCEVSKTINSYSEHDRLLQSLQQRVNSAGPVIFTLLQIFIFILHICFCCYCCYRLVYVFIAQFFLLTHFKNNLSPTFFLYRVVTSSKMYCWLHIVAIAVSFLTVCYPLWRYCYILSDGTVTSFLAVLLHFFLTVLLHPFWRYCYIVYDGNITLFLTILLHPFRRYCYLLFDCNVTLFLFDAVTSFLTVRYILLTVVGVYV